MQKTVLWQGLAYDTEEHCAINFMDSGIAVRSEIEGWVDGKAVYVEYVLHLNTAWETQHIEIDFHVSDHKHSWRLVRDENNNWTDHDGNAVPELNGCRYIDISLTPFTNSLPVNGLLLCEGSSAEIDVVYFDIMQTGVHKDRQKYTRLPGSVYRFENASGFSADIIVDGDGFVTFYPKLFEMLKPR